MLLLVRAGAEDRLAAALRLLPFDDALARLPDEADFARPFPDADLAPPLDDEVERFAVERFAAGLLVVRDALVPLLALADLLRVPVDFFFVVPLLERFFAPVPFGLASAIGPPSEAVTNALPETAARHPFVLQSGRF